MLAFKRASADCSVSANLSICIGAPRPRAKALVAHKEYNLSVRYCHSRLIFNGRSAMLKFCFMLLVWQDTASGMLHSPLEDQQARLSGAECGNIDARRQNPRWSLSNLERGLVFVLFFLWIVPDSLSGVFFICFFVLLYFAQRQMHGYVLNV